MSAIFVHAIVKFYTCTRALYTPPLRHYVYFLNTEKFKTCSNSACRRGSDYVDYSLAEKLGVALILVENCGLYTICTVAAGGGTVTKRKKSSMQMSIQHKILFYNITPDQWLYTSLPSYAVQEGAIVLARHW